MNVIMVDGGSTTAFFASELARRYSNQPELTLTIITNSYDIARTLAPCPAVRVIVCPGDFDAHENAVFGPSTSEFLMEFSADAAVFSAGGLSEVGVMDVNSMAACVKRSMIAQAEKTLLIVDDRKFGIRQLERIWRYFVHRSPHNKRFTTQITIGDTHERECSNSLRLPRSTVTKLQNCLPKIFGNFRSI